MFVFNAFFFFFNALEGFTLGVFGPLRCPPSLSGLLFGCLRTSEYILTLSGSLFSFFPFFLVLSFLNLTPFVFVVWLLSVVFQCELVFLIFFSPAPRNRFEQVHELEAEMDSLSKPHQQFTQVHNYHTLQYHTGIYHSIPYRSIASHSVAYHTNTIPYHTTHHSPK